VKTAVVLFNLGGPDSLSEVKPFLFNLFNDKAIIQLPQPLRWLVAKTITARRAGAAKQIYKDMGGRSPILELTREQAQALDKTLSGKGDYKVFIAMRYAKPFISDTVAEVKAWNPEKVILLPLYPQFSSTTTGSAFAEWKAQAEKQGLDAFCHPICCYEFDNHFIAAHLNLIKPAYDEASRHGKPRILFSAHGLPEKFVEKGDPYEWQVEKTVATLMRSLGELDHVICYQSRIGPRKWLGPSTFSEIERAGHDLVPIVVVPIAFVSEHAETLVELDIDYRRVANKLRVPFYARVPALGTTPDYIDALAWLVEATIFYPNCSNSLGRQCPKEFGQCGYKEWKAA